MPHLSSTLVSGVQRIFGFIANCMWQSTVEKWHGPLLGSHLLFLNNTLIRNREDEGSYQCLNKEAFVDLVNRTVSFLESQYAFCQAIAGCMHGYVMIIPVESGKMKIIHHGILCNIPQPRLIKGNLGDSCRNCNILPFGEATASVKVDNDGMRTMTVNRPSLETVKAVTTGMSLQRLRHILPIS